MSTLMLLLLLLVVVVIGALGTSPVAAAAAAPQEVYWVEFGTNGNSKVRFGVKADECLPLIGTDQLLKVSDGVFRLYGDGSNSLSCEEEEIRLERNVSGQKFWKLPDFEPVDRVEYGVEAIRLHRANVFANETIFVEACSSVSLGPGFLGLGQVLQPTNWPWMFDGSYTVNCFAENDNMVELKAMNQSVLLQENLCFHQEKNNSAMVKLRCDRQNPAGSRGSENLESFQFVHPESLMSPKLVPCEKSVPFCGNASLEQSGITDAPKVLDFDGTNFTLLCPAVQTQVCLPHCILEGSVSQDTYTEQDYCEDSDNLKVVVMGGCQQDPWERLFIPLLSLLLLSLLISLYLIYMVYLDEDPGLPELSKAVWLLRFFKVWIGAQAIIASISAMVAASQTIDHKPHGNADASVAFYALIFLVEWLTRAFQRREDGGRSRHHFTIVTLSTISNPDRRGLETSIDLALKFMEFFRGFLLIYISGRLFEGSCSSSQFTIAACAFGYMQMLMILISAHLRFFVVPMRRCFAQLMNLIMLSDAVFVSILATAYALFQAISVQHEEVFIPIAFFGISLVLAFTSIRTSFCIVRPMVYWFGEFGLVPFTVVDCIGMSLTRFFMVGILRGLDWLVVSNCPYDPDVAKNVNLAKDFGFFRTHYSIWNYWVNVHHIIGIVCIVLAVVYSFFTFSTRSWYETEEKQEEIGLTRQESLDSRLELEVI